MDAEQAYLDIIDNASRWNGMLLRDRSERLPFFDSQSGVTQNETKHLWHKESQKFPGQRLDQVFSYPAPRWKWHRKAKTAPQELSVTSKNVVDFTIDGESLQGRPGDASNSNWTQSELDNFLHAEEDFPEPDFEDDDDFYDDTYRKKRRRPGASPSTGAPYSARRGGGRRQVTDEDAMKPFICETCGLGYKTKPGLHYHLMKAHPPPSVPAPTAEVTRIKLPSNICDVCKAEAFVNQTSGKSEDLIVCADCGKAGHPTCLQFTANMLISVKKYKWQCFDCKACAICNTSENDDVLLFCDDCDRGYHMYCLDPPISEPPEGSWSCQLCLSEFKENAASSRAVVDSSIQSPSVSSRQISEPAADNASRDGSDAAAKISDRPSSASQDSKKESSEDTGQGPT